MLTPNKHRGTSWDCFDWKKYIFSVSLGTNQGQRTRLLLKVLAISDVVIYRTHADRLHDDLFKFLGDASDAYLKHFAKELKATTTRCGLDVPLSTLGPAVLIFHETVHTKLLGSGTRNTPLGCKQSTAVFFSFSRQTCRINRSSSPGAFQEAGSVPRSFQLHPLSRNSDVQPPDGLQRPAAEPGAAAG